MRINALAQLLSNEKAEHYHTTIIGVFTGFFGFIGINSFVLDKVITLIFALLTAFLGGMLAPMGAELYKLLKEKAKTKYKKWRK